MQQHHTHQKPRPIPTEGAGKLAVHNRSARPSAAWPSSDSATGGQMSISPPSKVKSSQELSPRPLASGIDTLYLSIDVKWPSPGFFSYLSALKIKAEQATAPVPGQLADWPFLIQPFGRRGYEWLLDGREFTWRVGNWLKPQTRPSVIVEIRSETLWHLGARQAVERVLSLLNIASRSDLANPTIEAIKVSRADLCLDLLLNGAEWSLELLPSIVCRAQNFRPFLKGETLTGVGIGSGNLSARLYDKPLEIRVKSGKEWMFDIWGIKEIPEGQKVIRVEFQMLREVLKELDIDSQEDLFRLESNAWAYCTQKWLKLQDRPGTHHTQRETLPWWGIVQGGYQGAQGAFPLVRCKAVKANQTQLIRQAYGLLASLTAIQMEETGENAAATANLNDCLSAVFETVGLVGENNDFGKRVDQKRAHYHRSEAKANQAQKQRREFGLLNNIEGADTPKGGIDANN